MPENFDPEASFTATGGANIGWMNCSWPWAKLSASPYQLELRATMVGNYSFRPDEVISIDRKGNIPVLYSGISIRHCVPTYPTRIVFWYLGNADNLVERIRLAGFQPTAPESAALPRQGWPFRWQAVAILAAFWIGLFGLPFRHQ